MPSLVRFEWKATHLLKFGVIALFMIVHVSACRGTTTLKLDDATPTDGKVHFRPGFCQLQPMPSVGNLKKMITAQTEHYDLFLDVDGVVLANFGYFVYDFYVRSRSDPPNPSQGCYFRVQAVPQDSFLDGYVDVTFQVGDTSGMEAGTINIPLHNTSYHKPILQSIPDSDISTARLTGVSDVSLRLDNMLPNLPVWLDSKVYANPDHEGYWHLPLVASLALPAQNQPFLAPGQKLSDCIKLALTANPWQALGASIFPLGPHESHETVHLRLSFNTPGGVPGTFEIPVRVRFQPSFWYLQFAVLIGATLGSGLASLIPVRQDPPNVPPPEKFYKKMIVAVLASVFMEALGMILVLKDSQFRILGFELDPHQLLPASLLGALVALASFGRADTVLGWIKKA
jgi:hypothetical protein